MSKKMFLPFFLGLVFSGAALIFAFKNIPVQDLLKYLGTVNYVILIPGALVALLSFVLRVVRWRWILKSTKGISFFGTYHPLIIGFMINCILPGRVGEIARPILLMKRENIPFSTGLASIVCERLFDLVCLLTLLLVALNTITIDPAMSVSVGEYKLTGATLTSLGYGMTKIGVVLILGIFLVSIKPARQIMADIILGFPGKLIFLSQTQRAMLSDKIFKPLSAMIEHFADGLVLLKSPVNILVCLLLSLSIWAVQAGSYHFMTLACPGLTINFAQTMAMMVMICFFIALPSVPGYWGIWEAGGIFALTLFSVEGKEAAGYTLVNHVFQIVPVIIAGLISTLMIGINFKQLFIKAPPKAS